MTTRAPWPDGADGPVVDEPGVRFDGFIAIDWSGARTANGIAVADCDAGTSAPRLVLPPDGSSRWTRSAVLEWLDLRLGEGRRLLIGFDFAFSLPFERAAGYFPGETATSFDLWELIDRVCADGPDFFGGDFALHPKYAGGFWHAGPRSPDYHLPHRATERACRVDGLGFPESPYKLIGGKQVGKAALAGMRVLHALRRRRGADVAFWPFEDADDDDARSVCVEIYPRLFLLACGHGMTKVRSWTDLNRCLAHFGCVAPDGEDTTPPSDHETDALVSAVGLRDIARRPGPWRPRGLDERARRQEGWIFGVGAS